MFEKEIREEVKGTLSLAWPSVGAHLLHQAMPMVDTIMLGWLGTHELAAMGMALPLINFPVVFSLGVLSVVGAQIGHAWGAGEHAAIKKLSANGFWVALFLTLLILSIFALAPFILTLCRQDASLIPSAVTFIRADAIGIPFALGYIALRQLSEGTGHTRPSFCITLVGLILNIILDYVLIYGKWGVPQWGIWGAGLATSLVNVCMFITMLCFLYRTEEFKKLLPGKSELRTSVSHIAAQLTRGLPFGGMFLAEVGIFAFATLLIGTLGSVPLASHQIALNIAGVMFMVPLGLGNAVAIRASHYWGSKNHEGVLRLGKVSFYMTLLLMTIPALGFILLPNKIVNLYTSDPIVVLTASALLQIAGIFQIADGSQAVSAGLLRGLKDTRVPFINALIAFWLVGFSVIYFSMHVLHGDEKGVWVGLTFSLICAAILHRLRFKRLVRDLPFNPL